MNNVGNNGYFWSPVVVDSDNAGVANFNANGNVNPSNNNDRNNGQSIRCVARPVASTVSGIPDGEAQQE